MGVLGKGTRKCVVWGRQESGLFGELKKSRVAKTGTKENDMKMKQESQEGLAMQAGAIMQSR